MTNEQRQRLLKVAAGAIVGLWLLDTVVIEPAIRAWGEQTARIEALQKKVDRGRSLLGRADSIRERWADMQRANLPADLSVAEGEALDAINRWTLASGINLTNVSRDWQRSRDADYDACEVRASLTGKLSDVGLFLYELETDPVPVNLEDCEITTRDARGQQITVNARFSFLLLGPDAGTTAASATPSPSARGGGSGNNNAGRNTP